MHWRYRLRKQELLDECEVSPEVFDGGLERLAEFARPFVACLVRREQRDHARTYLAGLASDLERKNTESIAYRHDQERHGLQHFVGSSTWDHRPLVRELASQVGRELGTPDGVIVFDPSGFPKKGDASAGVQRQWIGRLGEVDNGQVGVFMAYASPREHALVDVRLYLPKSWAGDRARRKRCGIPKAVRYRTRHELALEMLAEAGPLLPHGWVTGDDEMGRSSRFRAELRRLGEQYLLAVPSNTTVRDVGAEAPVRGGRGRPPPEALPGVRARVARAGHRVEECLQRGKGEAGLAGYQVRTWSGWHHHQALSLIASWFLVQEARRGKKADAGVDGAAGAGRAGVTAPVGVPV
jgi:SRSO17 transposase